MDLSLKRSFKLPYLFFLRSIPSYSSYFELYTSVETIKSWYFYIVHLIRVDTFLLTFCFDLHLYGLKYQLQNHILLILTKKRGGQNMKNQERSKRYQLYTKTQRVLFMKIIGILNRLVLLV